MAKRHKKRLAPPATMSSATLHRYCAAAVQREIDRDKRIKPREARLIHALLRGRD